ncbi:MAG: HEAT repeat domain-containing protein [Holophagales bacterium]|nr:HEAT repeat domain-containing protein [Holophagales bacterium]
MGRASHPRPARRRRAPRRRRRDPGPGPAIATRRFRQDIAVPPPPGGGRGVQSARGAPGDGPSGGLRPARGAHRVGARGEQRSSSTTSSSPRRLGDARFVPAWLSRLAGAPADLLRSLLRALGSTRDPRLSEPLLEYLEHPALPIRILAIEALGHPGNAGIGPELHRRLLTDRGCTYHLVRALGRMRHRPAADDLIGIYAGASSLEKIAIIEALGAMETLAAERFLKTELESFDRERQRAAAMALARHFRAGNLALFLKLARSQDWSLRNTAAWALGETGGEAARAALNELSGDRQEVVARTARTFLGRWR